MDWLPQAIYDIHNHGAHVGDKQGIKNGINYGDSKIRLKAYLH